jgi:NTP pyrophosphatase (non-canonical NTP hydrolase)
VAKPLIYPLGDESDVALEPVEALDAEAQSRATAEYLSDLLTQLESMARVAGLDLLSYLLSMARVEAETNARVIPQRRVVGRR